MIVGTQRGLSRACNDAGIQLSTEEIGLLLCPGNPYRLRGWPCRGGRGLLGGMHFSDVVMTLTGLLPLHTAHMHVLAQQNVVFLHSVGCTQSSMQLDFENGVKLATCENLTPYED